MIFHFQNLLFEKIKNQLDHRHTLVDHVTDLLGVSRDSGYRRIRGETAISMDEAVILANHFRVSLSEIAGHTDNSAVFKRQNFIMTLEDYKSHMRASLEQLLAIGKNKNHTLIYSAKDIPIFYQFAYPTLAAFKMYVWMKSMYDIQKIDDQNYDLGMIPPELIDMARQQWEAYSRINSIEIWNDTTIDSLLNQIEYFYEAGMLRNKEEAFRICDDFQDMIKIIYRQALEGTKVHARNMDEKSGATYKMYYHEILLMDNHILAMVNENYMVHFIPYAGVNFMSTTEPVHTENMRNYLLGQTKKSALISDASEKDRNRFFIRIRNRIDQVRTKIETTDPFL